MTEPFSYLDYVAQLPPSSLALLRASRYGGEEVNIALAALAEADQTLVHEQYRLLQRLYDVVRSEDGDRVSRVRAFLRDNNWMGWLIRFQKLGTFTDTKDMATQKVLHDLRGGAMQALSILLQLVEMGIMQSHDLDRAFFLTRDHLKIMRSALTDIDPAATARDKTERLHSIDLLTEKWRNTEHYATNKRAQVQVESTFQGAISERCLEFAALDRVIYNLINNATRFTANGAISLVIVPLPGDNGTIRFAVLNPIAAEQATTLEQAHGDDISTLFRGGFTTGGNGLGLRICADMMVHAFGLRDIEQAIGHGYLGARLYDSTFLAWFHWPVVAD